MAKSDCCFNCVYAWYDVNEIVRNMSLGWGRGPTCANQPGHHGLPTATPIGRVCPNYRPRPAEPAADAKRIILTNGMVTYVDAADYEKLSQYTWHYASGGYAARYDNRTLILMHRQIMNPPEGMQVDHIHHNRLDNTRAHLRICTASENARNRSKRGCASSRYFGVTYNKRRRKWVASIKVDGKVREVGYSHDEEEAARAHDYAAVRNFGDHVRLNFPEEWPPRAPGRGPRAAGRCGGGSAFARTEDGGPRAKDGRRRTGGRRAGLATGRATSDKRREARRRSRRDAGTRRNETAEERG